jgi:hypothetical protein
MASDKALMTTARTCWAWLVIQARPITSFRPSPARHSGLFLAGIQKKRNGEATSGIHFGKKKAAFFLLE